MSEKKEKTAVELLMSKLPIGVLVMLAEKGVIEDVYKLQKEQIMEAYRSGVQDYKFHHAGETIRMEEYYKNTYEH